MRTRSLPQLLFGFSILCIGSGLQIFAQTATATPVSLAELETKATAAYTAKQYAESARLFAQAALQP